MNGLYFTVSSPFFMLFSLLSTSFIFTFITLAVYVHDKMMMFRLNSTLYYFHLLWYSNSAVLSLLFTSGLRFRWKKAENSVMLRLRCSFIAYTFKGKYKERRIPKTRGVFYFFLSA